MSQIEVQGSLVLDVRQDGTLIQPAQKFESFGKQLVRPLPLKVLELLPEGEEPEWHVKTCDILTDSGQSVGRAGEIDMTSGGLQAALEFLKAYSECPINDESYSERSRWQRLRRLFVTPDAATSEFEELGGKDWTFGMKTVHVEDGSFEQGISPFQVQKAGKEARVCWQVGSVLVWGGVTWGVVKGVYD